MSIFIVPEKIEVNVCLSVAPDLLELFQKIVDQKSDRAEAAKLSEEAKDTTAKLAAAIPSP